MTDGSHCSKIVSLLTAELAKQRGTFADPVVERMVRWQIELRQTSSNALQINNNKDLRLYIELL